RKAFYLLLNKVRIQLQAEHAAKEIQLFLLACSAFTFCLFLLARFTVIIAVNTYVMTFAAIAAIVFFMKFRITRPGHKSAASLYDQYCGEDRVSTALAFIEKDETVYTLQRSDALLHMKKSELDLKNRKKKYVYPVLLGCSL